MKRLSDEIEGDDPELAFLGRLMLSIGPLSPSELRQRRVLAALRARTSSRAAGRPYLRTALAAGLLVLVGGIAGATIGRSAWQRMASLIDPAAPEAAAIGTDGRGLRAAPSSSVAMPSAGTASGPGAVTAPATTSSLSSPVGAPATPGAHRARPASPGRTFDARSVPGSAAAAPPVTAVAPGPVEDTSTEALMSAALAALRGDPAHRDPERARVLLEDYLGQYPNGRFAEAALAYDIEAAAAQSDPEAQVLARAYLSRYPNGEYAEAARRAVARFSSPP